MGNHGGGPTDGAPFTKSTSTSHPSLPTSGIKGLSAINGARQDGSLPESANERYGSRCANFYRAKLRLRGGPPEGEKKNKVLAVCTSKDR
jgi:hypothetical protein